jgi:hypothetical protein
MQDNIFVQARVKTGVTSSHVHATTAQTADMTNFVMACAVHFASTLATGNYYFALPNQNSFYSRKAIYVGPFYSAIFGLRFLLFSF